MFEKLLRGGDPCSLQIFMFREIEFIVKTSRPSGEHVGDSVRVASWHGTGEAMFASVELTYEDEMFPQGEFILCYVLDVRIILQERVK